MLKIPLSSDPPNPSLPLLSELLGPDETTALVDEWDPDDLLLSLAPIPPVVHKKPVVTPENVIFRLSRGGQPTSSQCLPPRNFLEPRGIRVPHKVRHAGYPRDPRPPRGEREGQPGTLFPLNNQNFLTACFWRKITFSGVTTGFL